MPCTTLQLNAETHRVRDAALDALKKGLAAKTVTVALGPNGSLAFKGWGSPLYADLCAYRKLLSENFAPLRQAIARAEVLAGRKLNPAAVASGTHSHDGGATWSQH